GARGMSLFENGTTILEIKGKRVDDLVKFNDTIFIISRQGFSYLDPKNHKLVDIASHQLLSKRFECIVEFRNKLVLGSGGNGMVIYDKGSVQTINTSDGLSSGFISYLYVENDSTLWVCTNNGLNRISFYNDHYIIDVVDFEDGL